MKVSSLLNECTAIIQPFSVHTAQVSFGGPVLSDSVEYILFIITCQKVFFIVLFIDKG